MSTVLIQHIRGLVAVHAPAQPLRGAELAQLPVWQNAYLLLEDGEIAGFGTMDQLDAINALPANIVDATGRWVLPAWCDSHTHLVYAESRENEFIDKIRGLSYAEIAAKGGGILNSAARLADLSEDELFNRSWQRLQEISALGTGSVEIKSGYGLSLEAELKMLRVIRRLKERSALNIKASFLGAHAIPSEYRDNREGYIRLIIEEMIPAVAAERLADYIDVFCETGFFNPEEMDQIARAGMSVGLKPKLHVNQLNSIGGLQKALELPALSVDHLETMTAEDIRDLGRSQTIGTLLPSAAFFLRMPYQPARQLLAAGAALALASDYNPGSSPSGNMNFLLSLACIQLRMLPEEAINAATINGAFAMDCQHNSGSIMIGKRADLILTKPMPSLAFLPYSFGSNQVERVMIKGKWI
ncbi:MAG: imidazolonepropionase [Chitinophagaceae bacterium]